MNCKVDTVILDWAGTTVDYGCFAPVDAFLSAFEHFGVTPTLEETRAPMGMEKKAHIKTMLDGQRLSALWKEAHGAAHTSQDVDAIYKHFEPALFEVLADHSEVLPGVVETVRELRRRGIRLGSTTGYSNAMMKVVTPPAARQGYAPDCVVCPEEVGGGRPAPDMILRNLEFLESDAESQVIKVGDTVADMQEGKNAGCITVGVLGGSSMVGLSAEEFAGKDAAEIQELFDEATKAYQEAGADYVIETFSDLLALIDYLEGAAHV